MPPLPPVHLHLHLSVHCCLSLCPPPASCPAGCCLTSRHATATSCPPVPPPLSAPLPLTMPLSCLLSGWLSRHLLSHHCFPSACSSASHCTTASHCNPFAHLVWLIVVLPLVTRPPPVCQCLGLSLYHQLLLHPSRPCLLTGWLSCHLSSCRRLPFACASASHCTTASNRTPLVELVATSPLVTPQPPVHLCHHLSSPACASTSHRNPLAHFVRLVVMSSLTHRRCLLSSCASTSYCTAAFHHAPLAPLVRLVVASPLIMLPLPPVRLHLRLSSHCCLSLCPPHASCPAGCCLTSCHATATFCPPVPPPLSTLSPLTALLLRLLSGWLLCHLLSCRRLPSACSSASHCTPASHCNPLRPLVWLVVMLSLITPPSSICRRLHLSLHCRLSLCPSGASCPAGCHVTSCRTATSRPPAPLPLIAPLSPLMPLVRLVVPSPLVTPPRPPVHLCLHLSLYSRLSLRHSHVSC
jgi:hypothetical protein